MNRMMKGLGFGALLLMGVALPGAAWAQEVHREAGVLDGVHPDHSHDFYLEAGRSYVIETVELASGCDTVLHLRWSTDATTAHDSDPLILSDDDSGDGYGSRIEWNAQWTGWYYASVYAYDASSGGTFTLVVSEPGAAPVVPPVVHGGARIYGLFVGITDYPGVDNDLPGCARDAEKLFALLNDAGMLAQGSTLLTDIDATVGNVNTVLSDLSARVGPNDVFLFFYSGHGSREGQGYADEPTDGRDELLSLYDGEIRDGAMDAAMDALNARLAILALDSCFSGGFVEAADRPGRLGLFASQEDVLSLTAPEFDAGGYLAHFLFEGLAGNADLNRDAVTTVGELVTYIRGRFDNDGANLESSTEDRRPAYQRPVLTTTAADGEIILS